MNRPKISVVIPTLNEEKYLSTCLDSFKKQTFKDFEMLIIDGGSTDKTLEIAKKYTDKITAVDTQKSNVCVARDIGAKKANTDIIVGADADTVYQKNHLETIFNTFLQDPQIVVVTGSAKLKNPPLWWKYVWTFVYYLIFKIYQITGIVTYAPGFNFSYRKKAFLTIGGYNTKLDFGGDELDLLERFKKIGKIAYLRELAPVTSNRRLQKGFFRFFFKEFLFYYWFNYISAKILGKAIIRTKPVR